MDSGKKTESRVVCITESFVVIVLECIEICSKENTSDSALADRWTDC